MLKLRMLKLVSSLHSRPVQASETLTKPTDANTVAEIKAYLDSQGISYTTSMTKAELLALVV
ncbi:hypothetical protein BOVMAS36_14430 [Streptococcus uberis]